MRLNKDLFDVGLFCMKQEVKDSFILENDKVILNGEKINILDLFGSIDEYFSLMTYIN